MCSAPISVIVSGTPEIMLLLTFCSALSSMQNRQTARQVLQVGEAGECGRQRLNVVVAEIEHAQREAAERVRDGAELVAAGCT